jgi:3-hydroxyisobutyrate dehydrogenase
MTAIGFIGLGNMGGPMAANLLKAGHPLRGYDRVGAAQDRLAELGAEKAAGVPEAVAGAEVVITMLPTGSDVRAVMEGEQGVLAHAAPGVLLIDSSTIDVETARAMHLAAAARGLPMLDAPVSGGVSGAAAGTLTFMVGGEEAAFERGRPVLAAMGRNIVHAGGAGAGQAAKLCNNLILGISMIAVAEGFALADRLGLSAQSLFDIASTSSGQCWSLTSYCPVPGPVPTSPANRDYAPGFAAALMLKDLGLAIEAAATTGAPVRLGKQALETYQALVEGGLGAKDFSVIGRELISGR